MATFKSLIDYQLAFIEMTLIRDANQLEVAFSNA